MAKRTEPSSDANVNDMPIVLNANMFNESISESMSRSALGHSATDHDDSDDDSSDEDDVLGDDSLSNYASLEEVNEPNLLLRDLDCSDGVDIKSLEMSPETNAKFQALLDAAGIGQFPSHDGRPLADPEVIRQLSNSVSCALDEAAAALGKLGDPDIIDDVPRSTNTVAVGHSNGPASSCPPTTLAQACVEGNLALVKQMIESGSDPDEITQDGETPLTMAVTAGFTEIVDVLMKNGANPNLRGSKAECTALMEAASAGYVEIVFMLLQNGADVNAVSSTGNTALHYACCGGHEECLLVLLDNNADVEVQNENGHTALMEAASGGHVNLARHLLKHGAGINTHSTEFKESALTLACYKGHLEMVKFLLDSGADHEHKTDEMHTALMEAAMDGHVEVARLLLAHGAHVNMPADSFESPLTLAACGGHTELASLLLGHGADLEEVNDEGYTPLMEAAREGHDEMVALLLAHGADVNAQTQETQETALTLASCGGFVDVAELLLRCGADIELGSSTPLMEAAQEGHVELVKRLHAHGANVNAQTVTGDTALHYACENDHEEVCKILLDNGADLEHCSEGGRTPLMKAARAGKLRCVRLFISRCSNVNRTTTNNEYTALSLACGNGHLMVVDCLLKAGADPKLSLRDGNTLLIEAAKGGHTDVTRLLLDFPHVDAETVQAQSVQAAAAAQATSGSAVPGNTACPSTTAGSLVGGTNSGTVADRLPAEGLPSIVPPPPPNANSASNVIDSNGGASKVAPPPLLPSSSAAAAAASAAGIRPAPQRASAFCASGYPSFTPPHPGMNVPAMNNATSTLVDEPWELPPAAGGASAASSAAAVLESMPTDYNDYNLLEEFRNPDKLDELLTRFMKIQEAATSAAAASAGGRRNKSTDSEVSALHPHTHLVTSPGTSQQQQPHATSPRAGNGNRSSPGAPIPVSTPNLPSNPLDSGNLGPGASKEKLTAIFERTQRIFNNPESTLTSASPLQQRKWNVPGTSVVPNPIGKSAVGSLSSGPLAQALSTLQQTQQQQLQQQLQQLQQQQLQQQASLSLPVHASDIPLSPTENAVPSTTTASAASYNATIPPPPPMTTSQLQQLEQQLLQTRQQIGEPPSECPLDNPLSNQSYSGVASAVSSVLTPTSIATPTTLASSVVSGNGVGLVPMSGTTVPASGCVTSNGSAATSSSTPCYSPHSPCYPPHSPHHFVHGESSIDINAYTDSTAETALTLAAQGGYEDLVRLLLDRGAYIEHRDNKGYTPLINAAINGHREVVRLLLDRQADMEAQSDRTKDTALSLACSGGRYDVAELLLQRHANKEHRNVSDYTPLSLAASGGYVNIINLLLKHGAEINSRTGSKLGISPLMLAAMNGHKEAVRVLLDNGSDINAMIETNRNTALTLACFQGRHEVVALLLERKALIEHRAKTGLTPLMEAASGGYVEVGRVLLEKGAEVNALPVPTSRDTALTIAADKGHTKFVQLLLEHGAHVEVKNKKGCSPLWLACNGGHLEVVQKLVQHHADVNSMDNRKTSCLMAAFRKGHLKVVKFLVKHVTQFPPDSTCLRYIQTIGDKELSKKCNTCMDIIVTAKDRQAAEANKNANNLLQELDNEKELVAKKQAALAKKREKKRQKRMKAKERERERVERPEDEDDDDVSSTIGGGLSSVAARGQSGFDADDMESDVLEGGLNGSAATGERESGDGGEMDEEAGGKRYKPSSGATEVQFEPIWSRLSPLSPSEPKGGGETKLKKSSKISSQSSHRSVASSRKGTVSSGNTSSSPVPPRSRRTPPLEVPMGTPTATTAGTTGHNLASTVVVSGGRQTRHNSNNNNATTNENGPPKLNSSMTTVEKKAAMARSKKAGKKASSPSSANSASQQSSNILTTTTTSSSSNRRKRGDQPMEKTPSRSPPPPPPPPATTAWSSGHPPSYSAAVAASSFSQPNGETPAKPSSWSTSQTPVLNVSVAPTSSSPPTVSTTPLISPPIQNIMSGQLLESTAVDQGHPEFLELSADTFVEESDGGSGTLVSSPLPSPGGPWITAGGGRNSSQHSHGGGGSAGGAGGPAGSAVGMGSAEHEWTTVAKRRISMPVSRREIGKVIGQSGTTINLIRQQSGAHIDIDNKESESGERQVHIRGPVDAVNRAKTMIEHLISGKPLNQLLSMPSSSGQSAVPLMSGVSATGGGGSGGGRKGGSSTKTTGATGTITHTSTSGSLKGSKPLPIRQQSARGPVIIASGSGTPASRSTSSRKGTAPDAFLAPTPTPSFNAWSGQETNFAAVAAAGVVRPVTNTSSVNTTVSVTPPVSVKAATASSKAMSGFPTLSESFSLSNASGLASTNDLSPQPVNQPVSITTSQAVPPVTSASTATSVTIKAVSPTPARVSTQSNREAMPLKSSITPDAGDSSITSLAPTQVSSEPRFHSSTPIAGDSGNSVVHPTVQPIIPQTQATSAPSVTVVSTKTSDFNRAPGSHRPKPPVVTTSTTTTTTITTISSEQSGDLTSEGQSLTIPSLLTPSVPGTSTPMAPTHVSSSRASPSSSPYPTAATTPVSSASQVTTFPPPSTPLPSGSPPASRSAPSPPPAPTDSRPSQSLVAVVAPSITPTAIPSSTSSAALSSLTVSSASCATMSQVNVASVAATPSMLASSAIQSTSVPAPIAPPVSYHPNIASMMTTPPGLVSNTGGDGTMTLPRISSLNPGANTFEPRAPSTIPNIPGAPQMLPSGHTTHPMSNQLRGLPNLTMNMGQPFFTMESLRLVSGGNTNFSGTGADPNPMMGVRAHNEAQMVAAASQQRPMFNSMPSSMGRNSSYFMNNTGNLTSNIMNNPNLFGGSQQQQQQSQQQHGNVIGSGNMNRSSNLPTVQHLYNPQQQQLGTGNNESGLNSPQQLLMLTPDSVYGTNSSNMDMSNLGNSGSGPDTHDSNFSFLLGTNSQTPFGAPGGPSFNAAPDMMNLITNGINARGNNSNSSMARPIGSERSIATANSGMKSSNWANLPPMPGNGSGSSSMYGNPTQQTNNMMMPQMNPGGATSSSTSGGGSGGTGAAHYNWGNPSWAASGSSGGSGVHPSHLGGVPGSGSGGGWPGSSNNMSSIQMPSIPSAAALQSGWPSGGAGGEWSQTGGPPQPPSQRAQPQQPSSHHLTDQ